MLRKTPTAGGAGTTDHAALLTNLDWLNSAHTGNTNKIPAFDSSGNAIEIDYVSQSFTPVLEIGGVEPTYFFRIAKEVKVGDMVTVSISFILSPGALVGTIFVKGYSYSPIAASAIPIFAVNLTFTDFLSANLSAGGTQLQLQDIDGLTGVATALDDTDLVAVPLVLYCNWSYTV